MLVHPSYVYNSFSAPPLPNRSSVVGSLFNGAFRSPSWGSVGDQPNTYKIELGKPGIGLSSGGTVVGIYVDAAISLASISSAGVNALYYNIFSTDSKYCPVGVSIPPAN